MNPMLREKLLLQGLDPRCTCSTPQPRADRSEDTQASAALVQPNPVFVFGVNPASVILPSLQLTFRELSELTSITGKPALDVGASYSPLVAEACLRGIPVFCTDLSCDRNRPAFLSNVERSLRKLKNTYIKGDHLQGHECEVIPEYLWESKVLEALSAVDRQLTQCPANDIRIHGSWQANDRHFSVVFSHHAVPQYSNANDFISKDLPELLRVTDYKLVLHPFQIGSVPLQTSYPGDVEFIKQVTQRARNAGFEFVLTRSQSTYPALTACFTRR